MSCPHPAAHRPEGVSFSQWLPWSGPRLERMPVWVPTPRNSLRTEATGLAFRMLYLSAKVRLHG